MYNLLIHQKKAIEYVFLVFLCFCLYFISEQSYVLFHTITEITTVVIGFTLMLIAFGTLNICENNYFQFLAIIFGLAGFVDLLHILTYKGINIFSNDSNMSVQLGILSEYYECAMLNISILFINKKFNWYKIFIVNVIIILLAISSIIFLKIFPICYIEGYGLTLFHQISEIVFSILFLIILCNVLNSKINIIKDNKAELMKAIVFQILGWVSYTLYNDIYGTFSLIGHLFNILAHYYGFKVIFKVIVVNPYTLLFKRLNNKVSELKSINNELLIANNRAQNMERLNEKFINLIPDGILIIRDQKIESANKRFLNMLEIDDGKRISNIDFTEIIDESYHEVFWSRINNIDRSIIEKPQQYEIIWKNKRKWVEITSLIANDENGEYIISAIRNIEDRKKAEETEQLLELKKKEENMKNEFFTNISHELRTPINVIYSALQVENDYVRNDINRGIIFKYNKVIRQNCLRLMRLINNIIDITKIETRFFKPNYSVENIVSIVEDITMSIVEYIESKKIKLIFDTEIEEAYVKCDSDLIERIMLNLLSNAVKYGKEGGNIEVYICKDNEDNVAILIKDDGIGIPDDIKHKIFDRFLRVDTSLSRKTEGSGIGLSLVKQLVEMQNGNITFKSKLNKGTEFKIIFPTVEFDSEDNKVSDKLNVYQKNIIESAEIEFSDIYY